MNDEESPATRRYLLNDYVGLIDSSNDDKRCSTNIDDDNNDVSIDRCAADTNSLPYENSVTSAPLIAVVSGTDAGQPKQRALGSSYDIFQRPPGRIGDIVPKEPATTSRLYPVSG